MADEKVQRVMEQPVANQIAWWVFSCFCLGSLLIFVIDSVRPRTGKVSGRVNTPVWAMLVLTGAYGLLIPGLAYPIFYYKIFAMSGALQISEASETMTGFASILVRSGGTGVIGGVALILYAMVIPGLKLICLILAEFWRHGTAHQVQWARRFVYIVQIVSKWASPDMFAYILLVHLVRGLNHPPILGGEADLDLGFTCFAIFCVFSTVATLAIEAPPLNPEAELSESAQTAREVTNSPQMKGASAATNKNAGKQCSRLSTLVLTSTLFLVFAVAFGVGIALPCMGLRLNVENLYEPNGPIPRGFSGIIESLHLPALAKDDVSMWRCLVKLAQHTGNGEANSFVGFCLFFFFVFVFTVADMTLLQVAAVQYYMKGDKMVSDANTRPMVLRISRGLKKLSMLDVSIVGIVLVVLSGAVYRKNGVELSMHGGLLALAIAEACHYFVYWFLVRTITNVARSGKAELKTAGDVADDAESTATEPSTATEV